MGWLELGGMMSAQGNIVPVAGTQGDTQWEEGDSQGQWGNSQGKMEETQGKGEGGNRQGRGGRGAMGMTWQGGKNAVLGALWWVTSEAGKARDR
jgi:hypothetical protein